MDKDLLNDVIDGDREPPMLFTVEQAARLLACGRTTIFSAISAGQVRAIKIGRATRIHRAELERVAATGL